MELMIVVMIIGIIATIAMPKLLRHHAGSQLTTGFVRRSA